PLAADLGMLAADPRRVEDDVAFLEASDHERIALDLDDLAGGFGADLLQDRHALCSLIRIEAIARRKWGERPRSALKIIFLDLDEAAGQAGLDVPEPVR